MLVHLTGVSYFWSCYFVDAITIRQGYLYNQMCVTHPTNFIYYIFTVTGEIFIIRSVPLVSWCNHAADQSQNMLKFIMNNNLYIVTGGLNLDRQDLYIFLIRT